MMKRFIVAISILLTVSSFASSKDNTVRQDAKWGHLYLGLGEAYAPVDYRIGAINWEFGIFQGRVLGVNYLHDLSDHFYMAFGGGLYLGDSPNWDTISFYSGVGAEFWKLWLLNFRSEIGMYTNLANYTGGKITFGINFGY